MRKDQLQQERLIRKNSRQPSEWRDREIERMIRSIPKGKVSSYSAVAAAAGYPLYHRLVAKLLRGCGDRLPWHRVLGADGAIRLHHDAAYEQRLRLEMEGVKFVGRRVDLSMHLHQFRPWEEE
ncbi:MAG: MGMT family protein [Bryobacteraceae bacterium]|nr:MGMT family protein [Bryobacteraceae bacterium]